MTSHKVPIFKPSWNEFKDFKKYIKKIEMKGAHEAGLCKIVPPKEYLEMLKSSSLYNPDKMDQILIEYPVLQKITGRSGFFNCCGEYMDPITVKDYKKQAESPKLNTPPHTKYDELERKYWKNFQYGHSAVYGAGVEASLMDEKVTHWNFNNLGTILDLLKNHDKKIIGGVNTPWLYFGAWKTTFAWHTEETELYSINLLHFGFPKTWYSVPISDSKKFEQLAQTNYPDEYEKCSGFLRHKHVMISPSKLRQNGIRVGKVNQEPGEIIITFPSGYHGGFNNGFNCAESTNFAMPRWIEYGKRSEACTCQFNCVNIKMDTWIRKFQPKEWKKSWKVGKMPEKRNSIGKRQLALSDNDEENETRGSPGKKVQKRSKSPAEKSLVPLRRSIRLNKCF